MKYIKSFSESGFSLPEAIIGLAITSVVIISGIEIFKSTSQNKNKVEQLHNNAEIQKNVEMLFFNSKGCAQLAGVGVGDSVDLESGNQRFRIGKEVGKSKLKSLKFEEFIPSDLDGLTGIARILLSLEGGDKKVSNVEIPVPVNVTPDTKIESCNLFARRDDLRLSEKLCQGAFGTISENKTCAQVLARIQELAIHAICEDLYGETEPKFIGQQCNLNLIHANKVCPPGKVMKGFNREGELICVL